MYNGWGSIYWDSSVGDTAAWGLHLQQVGVADQPLVDEFTTNYIVGGENLCLAPNFDNYTSEMGAISGITSPSQGSAVFNGTTDYIRLGDDFSFVENAYTFGAWVNLSTSSSLTYPTLFENGSYNVGGIQLFWYEPSGYFQLAHNRVGIGASYSQQVYATKGSWIYLVFTYDGTTIRAYKDGSLIAYNSIQSCTPNFVNVKIGGGTINQYWNGNIANVAVWNRALSSDEINSVMWKQYQDLNTQEINGLQAWYSLDSTEVFDWYNYAQNQGATIEGKQCVDNALNALAQL